jgi:Uma2 family endonuclease
MTAAPRLIDPVLLPHFTAKEYERMCDGGAFGDRRTELLEGVIYDMASMNSPHGSFLSRTNSALVLALGVKYAVRCQLPLGVKEHDSVPEPDFAVMTRASEAAADEKPFTAELVIEGSGASLREDRTTRLRVYARAKIPEYVIANLKQRQLEVFSVPDPKRSEYRQSLIVTLDETWRSKQVPKVVLKARELFIPWR